MIKRGSILVRGVDRRSRIRALLAGCLAAAVAGCGTDPSQPPQASLSEFLAPITESVEEVCPRREKDRCRTITMDVGAFRTALAGTGVPVSEETLTLAAGVPVVDLPADEAYRCEDDRPLYACTTTDARPHVYVKQVRKDARKIVLEVLVSWAPGADPEDTGGFHVTWYTYVVRDGRWVYDHMEPRIQS